jgi:hypothetical protein
MLSPPITIGQALQVITTACKARIMEIEDTMDKIALEIREVEDNLTAGYRLKSALEHKSQGSRD